MKTKLGIVLCAVVAFASLAIAQPGPDPGGMRGRQHRESIFKMLNLTDQQRTEIDKLRSAMQKSMIDNRAKIQEARVDLRGLFRADKPDRAAIEKKVSEISDLQLKAKMALIDHLFSIRNLLTPDQQKIWKEHMEEQGLGGGMFEGRRGGMRGGRMGGMRNPSGMGMGMEPR
jgi:Spy/CpxP family protein refolding chaperone